MVRRARLECGRSCVLARSGQTKDYKIGICCYSVKHSDWLARNHENVSEWGDMSIRGLLFH